VPEGLRLRSGRVLAADAILVATGLALWPAGGIALEVDGRGVDLGRAVTYCGIMLTGAPNLAYCFGYINASWTLRADLTARWVVPILRHLERHRLAYAVPENPGEGPTLRLRYLNSGYLRRARPVLSRRGKRSPWSMRQNYLTDSLELRLGRLGRGLRFSAEPAAPEGWARRPQLSSTEVSPNSPRWARSTASEVPSGGGSAAGGTSSGA